MKRAFLLTACVVLMAACQPEKQPTPLLPPTDTTPVTPSTPTTPQDGLSVNVVTLDASNITNATATLNGSYSGAPSTGVYDRGVLYGTSSSALTEKKGLNSSTATSGSFSISLTQLQPNTTYYYRAYVTVLDPASNTYKDFTGSVKSLTTLDLNVGTGTLGYHMGYEVPAINFKENTNWVSGQETPARRKSDLSVIGENTDNVWYKSYTTNEKQVVVTHTFQSGGKRVRNWTGLIDKDKQGPLWIAFVMHNGAYPRNSVGRYDDLISYNDSKISGVGWTEDPAVPSDWQRSVASSPQYSRGHFVASDYRQNSVDANAQTFYYTNQTLQWQDGFNSGVWSSLEGAVSSNAPSGSDSLYVVVGVLYEGAEKIIDTNQGTKAAVASHFYKLLMKCSFNTSGTMTAAKGCAYLYTNEKHSGNYSQGLTSIDAIEQRSGWDFFTNVPKNLQDAAESSSASLW